MLDTGSATSSANGPAASSGVFLGPCAVQIVALLRGFTTRLSERCNKFGLFIPILISHDCLQPSPIL